MTRANRNAKEEFLEAISTRPVKCAEINYQPCTLWEMNDETPPPSKSISLKWDIMKLLGKSFLKLLTLIMMQVMVVKNYLVQCGLVQVMNGWKEENMMVQNGGE